MNILDMNVMLVMGTQGIGLVEIYESGGILMQILLALFVIAFIAIGILLWFTRASVVVPLDLVTSAEVCLRRNELPMLIALCEKNGSTLARALEIVIHCYQRNSRTDMVIIQEIANAAQARLINNYVSSVCWLLVIGITMMTLALLGTVSGVMSTFVMVFEGNFEGTHPVWWARELFDALIPTFGALVFAFPCLIAYIYFRNVIRKRACEMKMAVTHLLTILSILRAHMSQRFSERDAK